MLYITGDTHIPIDIKKLAAKKFPEQKNLTKKDYVIICGDFGGVWDGSNEEKYWINWLKNKSFTILFVDGNHENFDMLNNLPEEEFCGGKIHKVDEGIYHLMRGMIYNIDGKKIFTFGGASSHDKEYRKEGKSWWMEELTSETDYATARKNLEAHNHKVDYIITHCAPTSIQQMLSIQSSADELTEFLEEVKNTVSYKKWFFGHYHSDSVLDEKHTCAYYRINSLI